MTPEAIKQALSSNETNEKVDLWLKEKFESLKNREESINELFSDEDKHKLDDLADMAALKMNSFVVNEIRSPQFNKRIIEFIDKDIFEKAFEQGIRGFRLSGDRYLRQLLQSDDTKRMLNLSILKILEGLDSDDRSLKECLPKNIQDEIKNILINNKHKIGNGVRNMFNDTNIHNRLKGSVSNMVNENISPMITMFISPDQISEKILQIVEKYINDPKSTEDYIMLIYNGTNKLMDTPMSELYSSLKSLLGEFNIDNISTKILSQITYEHISRIIDIIENKIIESKDILKEKFHDIISILVNEFVNSDVLNDELKKFIRKSINEMTNRPINIILKDADESTFTNSICLLKTVFNTFAEKELPRVIELFNISGIVERQINSFEVEYTEELILEIANKELKAITWLGALLGGIMGILSPLLQML